jgi:hypothetical protein
MTQPSVLTRIVSLGGPEGTIPEDVRFSIESPLAGDSTTGSTFAVRGWIATKDGTPRAKSIFVVMNGWKLAEVPPTIYRADLEPLVAIGFSSNGFEVQLPIVSSSKTWRIDVYAGLESNGAIWPLHLNSFDLAAHDNVNSESQRAPIIVNTIGRTGSTLLCHGLAAHQLVIAAREPLAENFFFGDLLKAHFRLIVRAVKIHDDFEDLFRTSTSNTFNQADLPAPIEEWLATEFVFEQERTLRKLVHDYYDAWERQLGKTGCHWFLEKSWASPFLGFAGRLFPGMKEILLVRDFRDVVVSMQQFVPGATRERKLERSVTSDFMSVFFRRVKALSRRYRERRSQLCLVRYEDLVRDARTTFSNIATFLNDAPDHNARDAMFAGATAAASLQLSHGTSGSTQASIGRWRAELPEPMRTEVVSALEADLELFGYETSVF